MGPARRLAGTSKREFLEELGKRKIERHYTMEELGLERIERQSPQLLEAVI